MVVRSRLLAQQAFAIRSEPRHGTDPSNVVVFDAKTGRSRITHSVEDDSVPDLLTPDGSHLFVSNWSSEPVSVIDTATDKVIRAVHVGMNPNA